MKEKSSSLALEGVPSVWSIAYGIALASILSEGIFWEFSRRINL